MNKFELLQYKSGIVYLYPLPSPKSKHISLLIGKLYNIEI